jgi:transcriptional regulator with XRE-family HTH domain
MKKFRPRKLAKKRKELGMTQRKLAAGAHLSTASVSLIENGKKDPRVGTVTRLAEALGCNVDYFFG